VSGEHPAVAGGLQARGAFWLLVAVWLATTVLSLIGHRDDIQPLYFSDPDDAMRLAQVRDFLAGQNWFDVSQHRANPPWGGPMHWSRLVDLPIAGSILLLRPFLGSHLAEVGAVLIVPALTLAALLAALYAASRKVLNRTGAVLSCALFAISPAVLLQFAAMRIDHHGWQIVLAAASLAGVLKANQRHGGAVAGLGMAVSLTISAEGFPLALLIGAVMAWRYLLDAKEWRRICCYGWVLCGASTVLLLLTHGWAGSLVPYCDAVSPVYLVPLAVAPCVMSATYLGARAADRRSRLLAVGLAAAAAISTFAVTGKHCLAGPFGGLDPQLRQFWYEAVVEGLPIWKQTQATVIAIVIPSLLGSVGYVLAILRETNASRKRDWITLLVLTAGATLLSIFVMRTMAVAHVLAVPGNAWLIIAAHKRARSFNGAALRVPATAASLILLVPIVAECTTWALLPKGERASAEPPYTLSELKTDIVTLDRLPPATLFAPIDISPDILLLTRHSIIGTGHHRNAAGMKLVIGGFVAAPEQARVTVQSTSANYLVVVRSPEMERYRVAAPQGLAARLLADEPPNWLRPVPLPALKLLRIYRIERDPVQPMSANQKGVS
jgi:hypothetical protein